jgi:hypothetical protein
VLTVDCGPPSSLMKLCALCIIALSSVAVPASAFAPKAGCVRAAPSTDLSMGWFDKSFSGFGNGKDRLDEEWEKQQAILRDRRKPKSERDAYFASVEKRRVEASEKRSDMWAWQTKTYKNGEDPIDEWKKRRADGTISDLENQYGDPKKTGGIPLPMASFGVGGEFGVGGKFDNGGRFDLRLPYADQGYVDEDADVMGKLGSFFGGGQKAKKNEKPAPPAKEEPKKKSWPW